MTIGFGDLKKGLAIELDGEPYVIVEYERSKMQKRAPTTRIRFREIKTGHMVDRTFTGYAVKLTEAQVLRRKAQYIYEDEGIYYFMDSENFEQFPLSREQLTDSIPYLVEQTTADLVIYLEVPIALELPITVDLRVTQTDPGHRGDTAQGATKPATLETGLVLNVPLFIQNGEVVKVDTRTGEYLSRA